VYRAHVTQSAEYTRLGKGILSWPVSGIFGLIASAISSLQIVGTLSLFMPSVNDITWDSLKGATDTRIPETPIPDVTDAVISRVYSGAHSSQNEWAIPRKHQTTDNE